MNSVQPIYVQTKPQAPPETDPKTGQEEVIKEEPSRIDPQPPRPSETPQLPGEGPNNPEEPIGIPIPDPDPNREEKVNFGIA